MDSGEHTASRSQDEAPQEKSLPQQAFGWEDCTPAFHFSTLLVST